MKEGEMTIAEIPEQVQQWTAKRRLALVLAILKGETSVRELMLDLGFLQTAARLRPTEQGRSEL
jgi:hypothetical protein